MTKSLYLYGLHTVTALLQQTPERALQLFVQEGRQDKRIQEILAQAQKTKIRIYFTSRHTLDDYTQHAVHQGIVVQVAAPQPQNEHDLSVLLDKLDGPAFLLILDGVQDPQNLGACLRSANAAGIHAVIVPKDKSAALTATAHKVASGAADVTPLIFVTNLARVLKELKDRGVWLYGASDDAPQSIYAADLRGSIAWVLGAEGSGMRRLTRDYCDQLYHIPMQGVVSSLNVSVATGVCLFEAVRQRTISTSK